jgi:hypothetical protein
MGGIMKRYKLLKDLPTFKAGDLFYISEYGALVYDDGDGGVMAYAKQTLEKFPTILTDWFEKVEEPTNSIHWNPRIGERCFILENANIIPTLYTVKPRDCNAWRTGKIFRTEEECKKARDRELAEVRLRRTSTFEPDFENRNGGWIVVYNYAYHKLFAENIRFEDSGEPVRYATKEDAEKSIKENEQDWNIYFGIEEEK